MTSLILSYATGCVGPNYGAIRQAAKWGNSDADNLARQLAREYAESRGIVRGVQNSSDAAKSSLKSPELFLILQKSCFVAGTRLLTPDGMKCIEEFQAGDLVLSRSEHDSRGGNSSSASRRSLYSNCSRHPIERVRTADWHNSRAPFLCHWKGLGDCHRIDAR